MSNSLILASGSSARANLLRQTGLDFNVRPSPVDEEALKKAHQNEAADQLATLLARAKAEAVAPHYPEAIVLAADQVLECKGTVLNKVSSRQKAVEKLMALQGQTHFLHSAFCLMHGQNVLALQCETACLTMRSLSQAEVKTYLDRAGNDVLSSVGCYHYEGLGRQLFETVKGDDSTVLGLPLLPVLKALRHHCPKQFGLL
jgi:septum formation protein